MTGECHCCGHPPIHGYIYLISELHGKVWDGLHGLQYWAGVVATFQERIVELTGLDAPHLGKKKVIRAQCPNTWADPGVLKGGEGGSSGGGGVQPLTQGKSSQLKKGGSATVHRTPALMDVILP